MNARQREKEIAARRALALRKLAKVFGTNGGDAGAGAYTAERQILVEILRTTNEPDVVALVRDRLAVIAEDGASTPSDSDDDMISPPADVSEVKSRFSSAWTLKALRDIAKGTRPVPSALATGAFWEDLVAAGAPELAHLRATGGSRDDAPLVTTSPTPPPRPRANPCGGAWTSRLVGSARNCAETDTRSVLAPRRSRMTPRASRATRGRTLWAGMPLSTISPTRWMPSASRVGPRRRVRLRRHLDRHRSTLRVRRGGARHPRRRAPNPAVPRGRSATAPAESRVRIPSADARDAARRRRRGRQLFSSAPRLFPRETRGRRRPTIDAFAETTENRPSCASGFLSRTPRWTPDVYTYSPGHADRTWDDPDHPDHLRPAEREPGGGAALRFSPRRAERSPRRRDRCARGRDRPCTGADRVASARTTTPTRVKIREDGLIKIDTREGTGRDAEAGPAARRGRVEAWRARFRKRRRGSSRAEGRCR